MTRKIIVEKGDIYDNFEIITEVDELITPSGEKKRNFRVKCLNCGNREYIILLNHLRQRDIPLCDKCNYVYKKNSKTYLDKN